MQNVNPRRLVAVILFIIGAAALLTVVFIHHKPKSSAPTGQTYCGHGDFPTSPANCQQQYGPTTIAVTGYSDLIDAGMSTDNLTTMKYDVYLYGQSIKQQIKSFDVEDPTKIIHKAPSMNPDGTSSWQFPVLINNKDTLTARVVCQNLSDARLYLYNGNTLVFDSQNTTVNTD